jgi:hypothetical protein
MSNLACFLEPVVRLELQYHYVDVTPGDLKRLISMRYGRLLDVDVCDVSGEVVLAVHVHKPTPGRGYVLHEFERKLYRVTSLLNRWQVGGALEAGLSSRRPCPSPSADLRPEYVYLGVSLSRYTEFYTTDH